MQRARAQVVDIEGAEVVHEGARVVADQDQDQRERGGFHGDVQELVLCCTVALLSRQAQRGDMRHELG